MSGAFSDVDATGFWHESAMNVLAFAAVAGPLYDDSISGYAENGIDDPVPVLDERIGTLIEASERAVPPESTAGLPILLGDLEIASTLLTASRTPDEFYAEGGESDLLESQDLIGVLAAAAAGTAHSADLLMRELPKSLVDKFEELEKAGADELIELVKSPTVQGAAIGGVNAIVLVAGPQVAQAFEVVKDALSWVRRQAVRLIEWVIDKLRALLPDALRTAFDTLIQQLKQKLADGIPGLVGDALGALLGRPAAERAWGLLSDERSAELEPQLDETVADQLTRIGYITTTRKAVDKFSIVANLLQATDAAPALRIVALSVVVAVFGFVGYQVYDGFHDLETLAGE